MDHPKFAKAEKGSEESYGSGHRNFFSVGDAFDAEEGPGAYVDIGHVYVHVEADGFRGVGHVLGVRLFEVRGEEGAEVSPDGDYDEPPVAYCNRGDKGEGVERVEHDDDYLHTTFIHLFPSPVRNLPYINFFPSWRGMFRLKYKVLRALSLNDTYRVYLIRHRFSRRRYIAKRSTRCLRALEELEALQRLKGQPGMPHLHDFYVNRTRTWLVFRWHRGGELSARIFEEEYGTIAAVRALMLELACLVRTSHQCTLAHLNICPENFVFTTGMGLQLVDFADARTLCNPWLHSLIAPVGTDPYAAPETQGPPAPYFTCTSDVYSLGVIYGFLSMGMVTPQDEDLLQDMTYENPTQRCDIATVVDRLTAMVGGQ